MERELMAGNSNRRGAVKKSSKGNPTAGSGGRRRKGLEGKGPTPKAEDRPYHKQHKVARAAERRAVGKPQRKSPKGKPRDSGPEWVAGRNAVAELLQAGVPVKAIHVAEDTRRDDRIAEIFRLAAEHHIALLEVPKSELDKFTGAAVHQGVAAKLEAYEYAHPDGLLEGAAELGEPPLVVMLDGVTDPRNLGAVIRSAEGAGATGVIVPAHGSATVTPVVARASAGAVEHLPVAVVPNLARYLGEVKRGDLWIYAAAGDAEQTMWETDLSGGVVLVFGAEGKGIRPLVRRTCDEAVSIPLSGHVESLNVSVAAALLLYEARRQRG
jgi:23S rRNA (guanosine2251-2'-O)-methyltransferase